MSSVTLYHNPRCSKSRQTLQLLHDRGVEPTIIEYLNTPPDAPTLKKLLQQLGISARELMRTGEQAYKENQLGDPDLSEQQLIQAMIDHPIIIQRPIVVHNNKAAIGRPPENVLEIV